MENCPLDKLPPSASEDELAKVCQNCELEKCILDETEDEPFGYDEVWVQCKKCKATATLWLENGRVEQVILVKSRPSKKKGVKRERIYEPAGKYYSKDGKIYHRCFKGDSECKVLNTIKGERP